MPVDEQVTGSGAQFFSWEGGSLLVGTGGGRMPVHAHYAMQVAFGPEPGIGFRTTEREPWTVFDGAIIASRQPHAIDVTSISAWAVIFVEPETREGRAVAERHLVGGLADLRDDPASALALAHARATLFAAWRHGDRSAMRDAARRLVYDLTGGMEPRTEPDERIARAIAYINAHLGESLTLEAVAAHACLSPSRFRHLFVEQTGMALRPYILWRRFVRVWELLMAGHSLSGAAHEAGFADAAHLTRTSRRMFGFPPSLMPIAPPPRKSAPSFK